MEVANRAWRSMHSNGQLLSVDSSEKEAEFLRFQSFCLQFFGNEQFEIGRNSNGNLFTLPETNIFAP